MTERKRRKPGETRDKLMEAALTLVGKGRHFASLGIREVTRQAGVVPTSFYRHFRNMDDLGLQLVDELGLVLRRMMRDARANVLQAEKLMAESVAIFIRHVQDNRSFFVFMAQGLAGESRAVQEGIRSELRFFASELANDLRRLRLVDHLNDADLDLTCDLVVRTVAFSLTDLISVSADDDYQIDQIRQRTTRYLQLIFVGAAHWQTGD
ncbi:MULTISPECIES: TetR family transcriptional regulator [Marinobacter]|uniref:TetR family transcriptional regulator n=1 Tax=Marinobacter TaxID=2742 RepID=UPI001D0937D5|nr:MULTISPECIES: TetR family transcriptional regulator [Marinobacter]MCK7565248.1 TetR family transcriptional regulator [Marinobacter xestospongiae]UDL06038.1 TetR family transcriptional regulator [Marinobacter sp. CA1]